MGENMKKTMPAIPPEDYTGSVGKWDVWLITNGYMKEGDWRGDVELPEDIYWDLLEEMEK